jgi:hypothetical protein
VATSAWYAGRIRQHAAKRKRVTAQLPVAPSTEEHPTVYSGGPRWILFLGAILLLGYYGISLHWSFQELGHCLVGMTLLWGPLGALLYVLLHRSVADPTVRLALSYAGSYTLTTLLYFGAAVIRVEWLFGAVLLAAAGVALWLGRRLLRTKSLDLPRLDSLLLAILAGSLVTTIPYSTALTLRPSGDRVLTGFVDKLYHVGLEYELSRHVPPSQATIRGGTPERAYHMFPHLTAMLIGRFTGQREMLRAHNVYHYAAITVLICLALYGIGFLLTAGRTGGYVCAFLPFLFAIAMRPIMPNGPGYFFFTVLPHATSTIYPTLWTSPQMYSGIAVTYGVLLAVAAIVRMPQGQVGDYVLPVLSGVMTAALLRFRVQCWIATLPVFLVFVFWMWYRSRRAAWLLSAAIALGVSALLYAEMSLPIYMRGTTEIHFALNGLTRIPFYQVWPFSSFIERLLKTYLSGTLLNWTWQVVCLTGFAVWDMIGIPLCIAVVLVPVIMKRSRAMSYYLFTIGVVLLSMVLAACLTMGYDGYSVPGQLPYHFGWYLLPLAGVGVAWLVSCVQKRTRRAWIFLIAIAAISGVASAWTQRRVFPSLTAEGAVITPAAWDAFQYLKEWTPDDAIVLSSNPWDRTRHTVSGLGGRSAYLDGVPNPVDDQALRLNPGDNRSLVLGAMGAAHAAGDPVRLCAVITSTPITHILEQASSRLLPNLPCLQRLWTGRDGATTVWRVVRK